MPKEREEYLYERMRKQSSRRKGPQSEGITTINCGICNKGFTDNGNLQDHIVSYHLEVEDYQFYYVLKDSIKKNLQKNWMKRKGGVHTDFSCAICVFTHRTLRSVLLHAINCHINESNPKAFKVLITVIDSQRYNKRDSSPSFSESSKSSESSSESSSEEEKDRVAIQELNVFIPFSPEYDIKTLEPIVKSALTHYIGTADRSWVKPDSFQSQYETILKKICEELVIGEPYPIGILKRGTYSGKPLLKVVCLMSKG